MNVLVIGATSAIAQAVCRLYAARGARLYLLARNGEKLEMLAADLKVRGAAMVATAHFDATDFASHARLIEQAVSETGPLDLALIAHGTLGDQAASERDPASMLREQLVNGLSVLSLLTLLAPVFEAQGKGTIAAISSVAGDRGRASNYVYGAAKGTVTVFLDGLRQRLWRKGVHVLTIKPGPVDTPMTETFRKGPLWSTPDKVAQDIVRAVDRKTDVLYTPWFWRFIMAIIVALPTRIFVRLKL